jgi:hypothetical protein
MKKKLSIKDMSPMFLMRIINKAKKNLKKDKIMKSVFKEHGQDIDMIDYIPTYFKTLDVSAKTDHGVVWLNYKLISDGFDKFDYSYLVHEYTHWLQQCFGKKPTKGADDGEYLDNKFEQEGFQNQVEYIADHFGEDEAEKYVDNLLDYHDVKDNGKKDKLEAVLLKNI